MESFKDMAVNKFRKSSILQVFYRLSSLLMVNAEKWNAKLEKWGRCQLAIAELLYVACFVFSTSSVFKVVYHECFVHLLLCQSYRSLRNVSLGP